MTPVAVLERPDITVVIPCYNEEENAEAICSAVIEQLEPLQISFDILFIDNRSSDSTVEIIKRLCAADPRVRLIVNTRNFGQMRSPTHAVYQARGRAVIGLCADFQDPPELIPELVARWRAGADIVLGIRQSERTSGLVLRVIRRMSYWLANKFGDYPVIQNATGFGLYDARVVNAIRTLAEPEPFWRGMLVETGYRIETIKFVRPPRTAGASKNDFFALLDFAMSAMSGSSKRLLRAPMYLGALSILIAALMFAGGLVAYFAGRPIAGWFIAMIVQVQLGLLFGSIGLIGDNVRIISERTRRTPLVIELERVNFPADY